MTAIPPTERPTSSSASSPKSSATAQIMGEVLALWLPILDVLCTKLIDHRKFGLVHIQVSKRGRIALNLKSCDTTLWKISSVTDGISSTGLTPSFQKLLLGYLNQQCQSSLTRSGIKFTVILPT